MLLRSVEPGILLIGNHSKKLQICIAVIRLWE